MTAYSRLPYPGLRPFRTDESALFFGRDDCIAQMIDRLRETRFLAVIGTSGSGKSSLVRTGLLDGLRTGLMADAEPGWQIAILRPGDDPFTALGAALMKSQADAPETDPTDARMLGAVLRRPNALAKWCLEGSLPEYTNLLVIVDQFEELFRYGDTAQRDQTEGFVARLIETAKSRAAPIYIVITMRSEFLGPCALIPGLAEEINAGLYLTRRMTRDETEEAIIGPAELCDFRIEPALVTRLLNDLASFAPWEGGAGADRLQLLARRADQLPLMQHVLNRLWTQARARGASRPGTPDEITLRDEDYTRLGGLSAALGAHADEILSAIPEAQRACAGTVFRALVDGNSIATATRRPCRFSMLAALAGDAAAAAAVVNAFRHPDCNFLTPPLAEPLADDPVIDISHESLIRQWPRLAEWMLEEARAAAQYQAILRPALEWRERQPDPLLLAPDRLREARDWWTAEQPQAVWAERYGNQFDLTKLFLDRSVEHERVLQARAAERRRRARRNKIIIAATPVCALVLAVLAGAGGYYFYIHARGAAAIAEQRRSHNKLVNLPALRRAAGLGDPNAQAWLGMDYYKGYGAAASPLQAFTWLQQAAAQKNPMAAYYLGMMFEHGDGVAQDYGSAILSLDVAANQHYAVAEEELGVLSEKGEGTPQDPQAAKNEYAKADADGAHEAEDKIGLMYLNGEFGNVDENSAMAAFQKAAQNGVTDGYIEMAYIYLGHFASRPDQGQLYAAAKNDILRAKLAADDAGAETVIGTWFFKGQGVAKNYAMAMDSFQNAAKAGSSEAEYWLGMGEVAGIGGTPDYVAAMKSFRQAIAGNAPDHTDAEYQIGELYKYGLGISVDYAQALGWFRKAAGAGSGDAEFEIGMLYVNGQGLPKDYKMALAAFKRASADGSAEAEYKIGLMYLLGLGVPQSYVLEMQWLKKSAADGCPDIADAQYHIGKLYDYGEGVKQDFAQAMNWYGQADKNGSGDAEDAIGDIYLYGKGTKQSYDNAVKWYSKAAKNGSAEAEYHLAYRYLNGQGVAQADPVQALALFRKAAADQADDADDAELQAGKMTQNGQGTKADAVAAMQLYRKAAVDAAAADDGSTAASAYDSIGTLELKGGTNIPVDVPAARLAFANELHSTEQAAAANPSDIGQQESLTWLYLLNGQPQQALDVANRNLLQNPKDMFLLGNKADALMLLGQNDAARALYVKYEDVRDIGDGDSWKQAVRGDFDMFGRLGMHSPLMAEILATFGK